MIMNSQTRTYASVVQEDPAIIPLQLYELIKHDKSSELDVYLHDRRYACTLLTGVSQWNNEDISPLMLAALNGHAAVVRVIISRSPAIAKNIDRKGCVYSIKGDLVSNATALWCALDRAQYSVAHMLINLGKASVDQGPRHPLLIDATFRGRFDIVRFLIDNGYADMNQTVTNDENKYNSLIIAAGHGHTQIVDYLIEKGARLNTKTCVSENTALAVAAMEGHLTSVRLLCIAGASSLRNRVGKTPIILAAENDRFDVVDFLLNHNRDGATFDDLELVVALHILLYSGDPQYRSGWVIHYLQQSLVTRKKLNIPKIIAPPIVSFNFQQECQSIDELDQIQSNDDRLYIEALLIRERILLSQNDERLLTSLFNRTTVLVERNQFDRCLHLMLHDFRVHQELNPHPYAEQSIYIFCRMLKAEVVIPADRFSETCRLILKSLQQNSDDQTKSIAKYLLIIAAKVFEQTTVSNEDRRSIAEYIKDLCRKQLTTKTGETLLHMIINMPSQLFRPQLPRLHFYRSIEYSQLATIRLLMACGLRWIDLDAVEQTHGYTALHCILQRRSRYEGISNQIEIIRLLIDAGAHIDCVNNSGETPLDMTSDDEIRSLLLLKENVSRLKCICARLIADKKLVYDHLWPAQTPLSKFVQLHGALRRKNLVSSFQSLSYFCDPDYDDGW